MASPSGRDGSPPGRRPVTLSSRLGPRLPAEAEAEVARFGRHIVARRLAPEHEAPFWLMWVRTFLDRRVQTGNTEDSIRRFVESMVGSGNPSWRVSQAERSVRCFCGPWRENATEAPCTRLAPGSDGMVADNEAVAALRDLSRLRHYSPRTEQAYVDWVLRYFRYLDEVDQAGARRRHVVSGPAIRDFLSHLATHQRVAASTQNQAFSALLLMGRDVLGLDLGDLSKTARARRGPRLPSVLSVDE